MFLKQALLFARSTPLVYTRYVRSAPLRVLAVAVEPCFLHLGKQLSQASLVLLPRQ